MFANISRGILAIRKTTFEVKYSHCEFHSNQIYLCCGSGFWWTIFGTQQSPAQKIESFYCIWMKLHIKLSTSKCCCRKPPRKIYIVYIIILYPCGYMATSLFFSVLPATQIRSGDSIYLAHLHPHLCQIFGYFGIFDKFYLLIDHTWKMIEKAWHGKALGSK